MILAGGDAGAIITANMLPQDVGFFMVHLPNGGGGETRARCARRVVVRAQYTLAQINRFGGNISRTASSSAWSGLRCIASSSAGIG
jgi:two-component system nitrogen regulation response regulator NtrX